MLTDIRLRMAVLLQQLLAITKQPFNGLGITEGKVLLQTQKKNKKNHPVRDLSLGS